MSDFIIEVECLLCRILLARRLQQIFWLYVVLTLQFRVIGLPRVLDTRKTPHHKYEVNLSYIGVRDPNPRPPLGRNVSVHETPQRIRGLENVATAHIDNGLSSQWVEYQF